MERWPAKNGATLVWKVRFGQTVMMSSTVEEIRKFAAWDKTIGLAYFYCAFNDEASQGPVNVLGSLLATLSQSKLELLLSLEP